jgi:hypothetical protein
MADMKGKMKDKMNDMENKAHELKGRMDQKRRDMKDKNGA